MLFIIPHSVYSYNDRKKDISVMYLYFCMLFRVKPAPRFAVGWAARQSSVPQLPRSTLFNISSSIRYSHRQLVFLIHDCSAVGYIAATRRDHAWRFCTASILA